MTSHYLKYANRAANLQTALSEEDLLGALNSHYPIIVQRSLISGNITTTQDAVDLLGKLDALEARDDCRNHGQNSETHDPGRRPHYNSRGERKDRNQRNSVQVQHTQYPGRSNYDRQRVYGPPNRHDRRRDYDFGWGQQEEWRRSRRTSNM